MNDLIYDRTQQDVDNKTNKGHYNYTDLNRIEEWCEYIAGVLNEYSYPVSITVKKNWTADDFPNELQMERIRWNVGVLKDVYYSFTSLPENLENMTYQKANAVEKILSEIDYLLRKMENNFIYCGVARVGQLRIWQQRFRRKHSYYNMHKWEELEESTWDDFPENQTWIGVEYIGEANQ